MLAVVDYEAMRAEAAVVASSKTSRVREYVAKLGKAQCAAEETLEMSVCNFFAVHGKRFNACRRYHRKCAA